MTTIPVVCKTQFGSFINPWIKPIVDQYLKFELWDPDRSYPKNTLFCIDCVEDPSQAEVDQFTDQGFRVMIDNLWEHNMGPLHNVFRLSCAQWFWYNESLWYQYLDYDKYQPQKNHQRLALMPMNKQKLHRTDFLKSLGTLTDKMIWSYVQQGRQLPGDGDMGHPATQRFFNPKWYDETYLSISVESVVKPYPYTPVFITEKTFKPFAFRHPFMVYGNTGTLKLLHGMGFVTFDNLWDESYDNIGKPDKRKNHIIELLKNVEVKNYDTETLQRLQHNHAHFFNRALVIDRTKKEILEPIVEYAET